MSSESEGNGQETEEEQPEVHETKPRDNKDRIIAQQRSTIKEMKNEFAATLDALRAQLQSYIDESTHIQHDMFNRIKDLKAELEELRTKSSRRLTPTQKAVKGSLYGKSAKHPRKLAQGDRPMSSRK